MSVSLFRRNARLRKNGYTPSPKGPSMFPTFKQLFDVVPTWLKVVWAVCFVFGLGTLVTLTYIGLHFVQKYW